MLFYTSELAEVEQVQQEFISAGIPCEIHQAPERADEDEDSELAELWIRNDEDCPRALMLCAANGISFSKRSPSAKALELDEVQSLPGGTSRERRFVGARNVSAR